MSEERKREFASGNAEEKQREIPRGEWLSSLDSFSRAHEGWRVMLEVPQEHQQSGVEAENLTFEGITPEHSEGHDRISIALGREPDDHLTHFVSDPKRLLLVEGTADGEGEVRIEAADGSQTVIRFRGKADTRSDVAA